MVLDCEGYSVDLVDSGDAAVELLEKQWPDVMLLDLSLVKMTGEEVHSRIRACFGGPPPTVVLSAVPHGQQRIRSIPGASFLAKPYTLDQLVDAIR